MQASKTRYVLRWPILYRTAPFPPCDRPPGVTVTTMVDQKHL